MVRSQNYYYKPFPLTRQARSDPPAPPSTYPTPSYAPAVYDFAWEVLDSYSGNDYGHQESRNDKTTTGSYHVALPDGRVQRVTYSVDGYGGYTAEVTYEGTASYPEVQAYKPSYPVAKPSYPVVQPYPAASQPAVVVKAAAPAPVEPEAPAAPVVEEPAPTPEVDIRVAEPVTPTIRR